MENIKILAQSFEKQEIGAYSNTKKYSTQAFIKGDRDPIGFIPLITHIESSDGSLRRVDAAAMNRLYSHGELKYEA